jgi:hypothetical protein
MIRRIGCGRRRTRVGTARMSSLFARAGMLDEVDDLDLVAPGQMFFAQLLQIGERISDLGD